jgi:hypothetical protein
MEEHMPLSCLRRGVRGEGDLLTKYLKYGILV